ncbi:hypothetical protein SBRY_21049 [Actinacidiphila bryophytorum]|uniref:Uncharacterized protein n=1 Tax=Actinacidiphila bryophytorum TaxID=1436133 RepID=A0A9W4E5B6_9ACTN|nr:hypothetical protein SBRY_21049 [Actinacidiphila bryophytorum]
MGRRRPDQLPAAGRGGRHRRGLGAARPGRRALPRRARRARGRRPRHRGEAGTERPGRGGAAAAGRGFAQRHPLDRRARRPAADHQGRPAHRPHPPLHPQLRPRDRARRPDRLRAPGGQARRRLGQAGRRLDRPGAGRPGALLAQGRAGGGDFGRAPGGRPGHRALLRRGLAGRPRDRRHRLHRARHRAHRRDGAAVRRARRRDRADAGQHRHLPPARGRWRGQVPALGRALEAAARPQVRDRTQRPRRRHRRLRRYGRRRQPPARDGRRGGRGVGDRGPAGRGGPVRGDLGGTQMARPPGPDRGRTGRPGRLRLRPARGRAGAGGAAPRRPARRGGGLTSRRQGGTADPRGFARTVRRPPRVRGRTADAAVTPRGGGALDTAVRSGTSTGVRA